MRITLDTNVLVSAFISKVGYPARLLDIISTFDDIRLVLSHQIVDEFERVLSKEEVRERFNFTEQDIAEQARAIEQAAEVVELSSSFNIVKEDLADNIILATAYDGKAEFLVSGNRHLLQLSRFKGIRIVTPRKMMNIISKRFGELMTSRERFGM